MYALWRSIIDPIFSLVPYPIRKKRLNFISLHYIYLTSMAILGSVILFGTGYGNAHTRYIDALFFASGAATQSGLNTMNVNQLNTGQQMVLYFMAMLCNPIFINSFVVFIRLYWFEKRFQHIVREAKNLRRTKTRSRTNTFNDDDVKEVGDEEMGVRGRDIRIIRTQASAKDNDYTEPKKDSWTSSSNAEKESDSSDPQDATAKSDQVPPRTSGDNVRLPQQMSAEQHIAFLENQRNPKDHTTLRIPSPREFDRGGKPEAVFEDEDENEMTRQETRQGEGIRFQNMDHPTRSQTMNNAGTQMRSHITIDEPDIQRTRNKTGTFPRMGSRTKTAGTTGTSGTAEEPGPNQMLRKRRGTFSSLVRSYTTQEKSEADPMPYLSWEPTIGRNSMFVNLTEEQREELGGIEYRALKTLAIILVTYFLAFHVLGVVCLVPWILHTHWGNVVRDVGQGRVWWGIFTAASAFNDLGFTLTPDSMNSFGAAILPMLLMTFLIVIGNTGFPCMLRFVIWLVTKFVPRGSGIWEELHFLLDHPRRCFTLLFPRGATWWLFVILVVLNGVDLIFFIILDLNDSTVTNIPPGLRFVDGLFQASSTRTAGFSVVNLSNLHPAIQVSYLVMMYISVFPIAISLRRTNVYEEKSLGIYGHGDEEEEDEKEPSYVGAHLRRQLSFDLWYIFLGMFIIAIAEGSRLQNTNEYAFTLFSVLFEIVSAYGTVGLSLGYPGIDASFSAEFNVISKLVIIAMQIRGRHRGLPYELDRAILLPSESLHQKEAAEAERIVSRRRGSSLSHISAVTGEAGRGPFRAETGLSNRSPSPVRGRQSAVNNTPESHPHMPHGPKTGIGNIMFKLAARPDLSHTTGEKDNKKE